MQRIFLATLTLLVLSLTFGCQKESVEQVAGEQAATDRGAITLPAGSHNALQDALDNYTTVILAPGLHTEDNMVVVSGKRHIVGRPGAEIQSGVPPLSSDPTEPALVALHFKDAAGSSIQRVKFSTPGSDPGCPVMLIENSPNVSVKQCVIENHQFGLFVEKSPSVRIADNTIHLNASAGGNGITVISGEGAVIEGNEVTGGFFGIWPCDRNGTLRNNNTHGNFIGVILCKVPEGGIVLPDGTPTGADYPCTGWTVRNNTSNGNGWCGFMIIDGANNNFLQNNNATGNGAYDYDLVGESMRFNFLTPTSYENTVHAASNSTYKDCGVDNTVIGGINNPGGSPCTMYWD